MGRWPSMSLRNAVARSNHCARSTSGNSRRTLQLAVHHTDAEREFAYDTDPVLGSGTEKLLAAADGLDGVGLA